MTLFRNRYRVESARMSGWDYRTNGHYFVTIWTRGREPFYDEVVDGAMVLSTMGTIVAAEWKRIAIRRRDVELDDWVIMPTHVHGVVVLQGDALVETPQRTPKLDALSDEVSLTDMRSPERIQQGVPTTSRLPAGSLGAIIGQFKSRSTKRIWRDGFSAFAWQSRFYDHVIRNEPSLNEIRKYIIDNPLKWELDKDKVENLYM
jgi:putative transposase